MTKLSNHDVGRFYDGYDRVAGFQRKLLDGFIGDGRCDDDPLRTSIRTWDVVCPLRTSMIVPLIWFRALSFMVLSDYAVRALISTRRSRITISKITSDVPSASFVPTIVASLKRGKVSSSGLCLTVRPESITRKYFCGFG